MKKMFYLPLLFAMLGVSCQKLDVATESENAITANLPAESEIAQAEKELGVQLFKKDVEFKDDLGLNKVVFRFGAKDEKSVNDYLSHYTVKIRAIMPDEKAQLEKTKPTESISNNNQPSEQGKYKFSGVAIDFISKTLQKGAVGYGLELTQKQTSNTQARQAALATWHLTDYCWFNYPDVARVNVSGGTTYFNIERRYRWWWFSYGLLYPAARPQGLHELYIGGDQWKVKLEVDYPANNAPSIQWIDY
jgi:hypothetical protein